MRRREAEDIMRRRVLSLSEYEWDALVPDARHFEALMALIQRPSRMPRRFQRLRNVAVRCVTLWRSWATP